MHLDPFICHWICSFLWRRRKRVRINNLSSELLPLSTGAPQGSVLLSWLFSLFTNHITFNHSFVTILKYAANTTITGLITNNNKDWYHEQVAQAVTCCRDNNLQFNTSKTQQLIIDFRHSPLKPPYTSLANLWLCFCLLWLRNST